MLFDACSCSCAFGGWRSKMRSSSNVQYKKVHMVIIEVCDWCTSRVCVCGRQTKVKGVGERGMGGGVEGETQARARDEVIQQSKYWQVCARSCPFKMSSERAATNISFYYLLLLLTIRPSWSAHVFIRSHTICDAIFFLLKCNAQSVVLLYTIQEKRYDERMSRIIYSPFSVAYYYYYYLFHFCGTAHVHLFLQCPLDALARPQHTILYWNQKQSNTRFVSQWMQQRALHARQIYNNKCLAKARSVMWERI